ncbi:hypothetical protein SUGI_0143850 [Cryptomeria japonica]|nr:hypothetical protein SUGI_0143850 [Cryptomeria japonica]
MCPKDVVCTYKFSWQSGKDLVNVYFLHGPKKSMMDLLKLGLAEDLATKAVVQILGGRNVFIMTEDAVARLLMQVIKGGNFYGFDIGFAIDQCSFNLN